MDLTVVLVVVAAVWTLIALLVLSMCRAAASADARAERLHAELGLHPQPGRASLPRVASGF